MDAALKVAQTSKTLFEAALSLDLVRHQSRREIPKFTSNLAPDVLKFKKKQKTRTVKKNKQQAWRNVFEFFCFWERQLNEIENRWIILGDQ